MSEHDQQVAVVQWFRLAYPRTRIISIPSGQWIAGDGKRKFALIAKYKKEGWTSGVSDLLICAFRSSYGGLWLEMKDIGKTKSSVSKDQQIWMNDMRFVGYAAEWAAGFEAAQKIIKTYMELK